MDHVPTRPVRTCDLVSQRSNTRKNELLTAVETLKRGSRPQMLVLRGNLGYVQLDWNSWQEYQDHPKRRVVDRSTHDTRYHAYIYDYEVESPSSNIHIPRHPRIRTCSR